MYPFSLYVIVYGSCHCVYMLLGARQFFPSTHGVKLQIKCVLLNPV